MSSLKNFGIGVKFDVVLPIIEVRNKAKLYEIELIGKSFKDVVKITSRIDCFSSAAHTISTQIAVENALNIVPSTQTFKIRELILKSEIIYSHLSYLCTRVIVKFSGNPKFNDYIRINEKDFLKNIELLNKCEKVLKVLTKRYPHPINTLIGSHLIILNEDEKKELISLFKEMIYSVSSLCEYLFKQNKLNIELIHSTSSAYELDYTPFISKKIKMNDEEPKNFIDFYNEFNKESSSFVGPIGRMNNNKKLLSNQSEKLIKRYGLKFPQVNPYYTPLISGIETIHLIEQCVETLLKTHFQNEISPQIIIKEGVGYSCVESSKGTLFYKIAIDNKGIVTECRIITPFEQNERFIHLAINKLSQDADKKTRKQLIDEINLLIEMFYI